jgi:hypothetical protein
VNLVDIQRELARLDLHAVNLEAISSEADQVVLRGSLLAPWKAPSLVDGAWLLNTLRSLPDAAGGRATMEALCASHEGQSSQELRFKCDELT